MQPHSATLPSPPNFPRLAAFPFGMLLTGAGKLFAPPTFAVSIAAYDSLPSNLIGVVATPVIITKVAPGGALLIGYRTRLAALLATTLLCVFTPTTLPARRGLSLGYVLRRTTMARTHL
jgi:uncharacterized membrane protein YphA (DoxX/SURF4 family)